MASLLDVDQLIQELRAHPNAAIKWHGWQIEILRASSDCLYLSTIVYCGDAYVPPGVREAVQTNPLGIVAAIRTSVKLDERTHQVTLIHEGTRQAVTTDLANILEEFSWVAERWWQYLNERDRRDLVYVRIK